MTYEQAFKGIKSTAQGWVGDILFDDTSTEKDYIRALTYIISMVDAYTDAIEGDNK